MSDDQPTVGLIHNYDSIDEFLDSMKLTFPDFCENFVGSFLFGYIKALQTAGIRPVLFCITAQVTKPTRFEHLPTGATICALPHAGIYRFYRHFKANSLKVYGAKQGQAFKDIEDGNRWRRSLLTPIKDLLKSTGSYGATPLAVLARELQRENCQALLCQEYEYARFDACVAMGKRIKLPVYACFQGGDRTFSFLEAGFRRWALHNCAGLIIASEREIERVRQRYHFPAEKIQRIFNPLDLPVAAKSTKAITRDELGIAQNATVVVWHGRVEIAQKGLDILMAAWQKICLTHQKDLILLLIGTGSDAPRLRKQIETLNLTGIVWIECFISDRNLLSRYLNAADLYTLPSRKEGFPLAPIEAMACGLPVVMADAAGIRDILPRESDGGIIVPMEDVDALATAITKLLDNDTLRAELGKRAKQRASYFSLETIGLQMRKALIMDR